MVRPFQLPLDEAVETEREIAKFPQGQEDREEMRGEAEGLSSFTQAVEAGFAEEPSPLSSASSLRTMPTSLSSRPAPIGGAYDHLTLGTNL